MNDKALDIGFTAGEAERDVDVKEGGRFLLLSPMVYVAALYHYSWTRDS